MKTPLSCHTVHEDLKAFLDGELSSMRRIAVQFHLRQCALCRAEVKTMTQISHDLQKGESTSGTATIAPELRERILQNLPDATPVAPSLPSIKRKTPRFLVEYSAAFCLVAVVLVASFSLMGRRVSNTFNAAANQMSEGTADELPLHANLPQSAPMTGTVDQLAGLNKQPNRSANSPSLNTAAGNAKNRIADYSLRPAPSQQSKQLAEAGAASSSRDTSNLPAALRRVHKEARLTVAVDDIEAQSAAAEQSVRAAGGYIVSNDLNTGADNRKSARLELRVPVGRFEGMVSELSQLGEVRAKQVTGQDITEQFSDSQQAKNVLTSELTTRELQLKEALARIEAARKKKKYAADPWELRAEVRRLRVEASQARARLELMRKLSELSAITLELKEKSLTPTGGFSQELNETLAGAGDTFLAAARLPLKLLIWFFAYSPLWLPLIIAYRLLTRRPAPRDLTNP
jgi:Flp pilus assembly pilin Flp